MKHLKIGKSLISAKGILAQENIKKGEIIAYVRGPKKHLWVHTKQDANLGPNWIGMSARVWVDPSWPFNYINHSCNPNGGIQGKTRFRAMRDIRKGEEITMDYSTTECSPLWEMKCLCGEKNCRKTIRSIQFLTRARFNSYLPFVPTYFKKVFYATH
jgi:uncharacterized protein